MEVRRGGAARASEPRRQAGRVILDRAMPVNTMALPEARATATLENIVTTTERPSRLANVDPARAHPATRGAPGCRSALRHGFDSLVRPPCAR